MLYLSLGFLLLISSFIEIFIKDRGISKTIFIVLAIFLVLFVGLRDGSVVGTDSPAYYLFYKDIYPDVEVGYKYINAFFASQGFKYNVFLIFINALALNNLRKFIQNNSYYIILPLFIYYSDFFFYYNFSGIRQAIAMSFTALSISYIFQGKKLLPIILILIASTFHVTSLVTLTIFFLPKDKLSVSKYVRLIALISLGILAAGYVIQAVPYLNYKFLYYSSLQEQADDILNNYYVGIVKRLFVLIAVLLIRKKFFSNPKNFFLYNIYLIGFIVYAASYLISPDFGVRFGSYFIILDCILISTYIYEASRIENKLILFLFFSGIAMYKIYTYTLIPSFDYQLISF